MQSLRLLLLALFLCSLACCSQTAGPSNLQDQIVTLSQQRFRAFAAGDRSVLQSMVADDAIFMYSDGRVLSKSQMLDALVRFPGKYEFHYEDVQIRNFNDSVMLCFRLIYHDSTALGSEPIQYLGTETFALRKGQWRLVGVHGTAVPYPSPHRVSLPTKLLDEYVGQYKAGDYDYEITREGDQLFGQRSGFPKAQWHAEEENIFFVDGDTAARRIFVRDKKGQVNGMIRIGPEHYAVWSRSYR